MIVSSTKDTVYTYQDGSNIEGFSLEGIASELIWGENNCTEIESILDKNKVIANSIDREDALGTEEIINSDFWSLFL